jgi:hypothetical protein
MNENGAAMSEAARIGALQAAAAVVQRGTSRENLEAYAESLLPWIVQAPTAALDVTLSLDGKIVFRSSNGGTMATNAIIGTNTTVMVNVLPKDASDNTTDEDIRFTVSDPAGALAASVSADTRTWTGTLTGTPGDVRVTANAAVTAGVPPYIADIAVTTGPTTHLVGTVTVT